MAATPGEQTWTLDEPGVTIVRIVAERRAPAPEQVLKRLIAGASGVPADDVELDRRCRECGARHGVPQVEYPVLPSGARWHADVASVEGIVVAACGARHPLAVAVEAAGPVGRTIDEAAFHAAELAVLDAADDLERGRLRARMWARKAALARALGHRAFLEPARIELTSPRDDAGTARLVRGVPELGAAWRRVAVHDVPALEPVAAAVAVLG